MFSLRKAIGTGAPARRRPARECKVGIESLDTRAVPTILVFGQVGPADLAATVSASIAGPVQGGDVVVPNFQSGQISDQISDLIRFHTVSDPFQGTVGYSAIIVPTPGSPLLEW